MRRISLTAGLLGLATVALAQAQTAPTPGMGATTPLGTPSSTAMSAGSSGIPLGATEMNTPGMSPLISSCGNASSSSAFDGGGTNVTGSCGSATSSGTGAGTGMSGLASSTSDQTTSDAAGTAAVGSNTPLGATSLGTPGESPIITVPGVSTTPCSAASQANSNPTSPTGASSVGGC
jgi:hypothetical protein